MRYYPDIRLLLITLMITMFVSGCGNPEAAWKLAEREDNQRAYLEFLANYPQGELADQARARIAVLKEMNAWERAQFRDRIDNYERFIGDFPDSEFVSAARTRIAELDRDEAWQAAVDDGSIAVLEAFLGNHPDAPQKELAKQLLAELRMAERPESPQERAGDYRLQLGAFRTAQSADAEVRRLVQLYGDTLMGPVRIQSPPTNGRFFTLTSVPMTHSEAHTVCSSLRAARQNCLVINR